MINYLHFLITIMSYSSFVNHWVIQPFPPIDKIFNKKLQKLQKYQLNHRADNHH